MQDHQVAVESAPAVGVADPHNGSGVRPLRMEATKSSPGRWQIWLLLTSLLVSFVAMLTGIAMVSTSSKKQQAQSSPLPSFEAATTKYLEFRDELVKDLVLLPQSPQAQALKWLALQPDQAGGNSTSMAERYALAVLFFHWSGPTWNDGVWMNGTSPECTWMGVTCNQDLVVTSLDMTALGEKKLVTAGTLATEIGYLTGLQQLVLPGFNLQGSLPSSFYNLTNLQHLDLSGNRLSKFDSSIGRLTKLTTLLIGENRLHQTLPVASLAKLVDLERLDLSFNPGLQATDFWDAIHSWSNLTHLKLSNTKIDTNLPDMTLKLQALELDGTPFYGTIPTAIGSWTSLLHWSMQTPLTKSGLDYDYRFPTQVGLLVNLELLNFDRAGLTGTLMSELGSLTNLKYLSLYQNRYISGTIPTEWGYLVRLETLVLGQTSITGSIPTELGLLSDLDTLWLADTSLTGSMPDEICINSILDVEADCPRPRLNQIPPDFPHLIKCSRDCCPQCFGSW
jgi:hypothetical protein